MVPALKRKVSLGSILVKFLGDSREQEMLRDGPVGGGASSSPHKKALLGSLRSRMHFNGGGQVGHHGSFALPSSPLSF